MSEDLEKMIDKKQTVNVDFDITLSILFFVTNHIHRIKLCWWSVYIQ